MRVLVWGLIGLCLLHAQEPANQPVPFTLADRDRLLRVEERLAALQQRMDHIEARIDRIETRIDRIEVRIDRLEARIDALIWAVVGMAGTMLASIVGLIIALFWDRRRTLQPIEQKVEALQKDTRQLMDLIRSLREYARQHADLQEILQRYGLA